MLRIRVTAKKDGREVAWYRDSRGRRVGTSIRATSGKMSWTTARQMMELGLHWIALRRERVSKGIGSDGLPMPALKQPKRKRRWSIKQKKLVEYGTQDIGYPAFKRRVGLRPIRDLYGPGGLVLQRDKKTGAKKRYLRSGNELTRMAAAGHKGHMLDDIRVNYVDDTKCTIDISTRASRVKARANEERAPWWASPASEIRALADYAAGIFRMAVADRLFTLGIIGANALGGSVGWLRKAVASARKVA